MAYPYAHGSESLTSNSNLFISTMVTDYAPTAAINTTSALVETVSVTGIDRIFDVTLSTENAAKLLNSFDVSGFKLDPEMSQLDPNMANLTVELSASGDFAAVIRDAVERATDSSSNDIQLYLETRLRNAIKSVFGSYLGNLVGDQWSNTLAGSFVALSGDNTGTSANTGPSISGETSLVPGASGEDGSYTEQMSAAAAMTSFAETTMTGLAVKVDLSEGAMAANCAAEHFASNRDEDRRVLFRQIPKATWEGYYADDVSNLNTRLTTCALPMNQGQTIAFIFDIDIQNTQAINDTEARAEAEETIPSIAATQNGLRKFQMNLGNRRIAFRLKLGEGDGTNPFVVGTNAGELKPQEGDHGGVSNNA